MTLDHQAPGDGRASAPEPADDESTPLPLLAAGLLAGGGAAALSLVLVGLPILGAWLLSPESDVGWSAMLRTVAGSWLAAQAVPVLVDGVLVTLLPWGLGAVCAVLLILAGRWAARASAVGGPGEVAAVVAPAAIVYAAIVGGLAGMLGSPVPRAVATALVAAAALTTWGVLRGSGVRLEVPALVRRVAAAAGVALGVLVLAGGVLTAVALVSRSAEIAAAMATLAPDVAGAVALTLLSLGYVPILVIWGTCVVLGLGFSLGPGVVISPFAADPAGPIPALPVLAAVPDSLPTVTQALPVLGLLAGVLAGLVLRRRGATGWPGVRDAVLAAAAVGAGIAVLAFAASGALGRERLAALGPDVFMVSAAAAVVVLLGAVAVAAPRADVELNDAPADRHAGRPAARRRRGE